MARARGTVAEWFTEEGWGRLTSPDLDGPVFAHLSAIRDQVGFRELRPGAAVTFTWVDRAHDGCTFRAEEIRSDPPSEGQPVP